MESDTFYGDLMVKLIWTSSGNLICHVFSMKTPDNLQTNFTTESPLKSVILHTFSVHVSILIILVIRSATFSP